VLSKPTDIDYLQNTLSADSIIYYHNNGIYNRLATAEDHPGLIIDYLKPLIKDSVMLDAGCGTGKYIELFAPLATNITGVDISKPQLDSADLNTALFNNVTLVNVSADSIPIETNSIDMIIGSWFLGTVLEEEKRVRILEELNRVLRPTGSIILIENDSGGEFEEIRGRIDNLENRTTAYNEWLITKASFSVKKKINTYFKFDSPEECYNVIGTIWGEHVASKTKSDTIQHNVIIFQRNKI